MQNKKVNRSTFLLITAVLSFAFGALMFFVPGFAAGFLDMAASPQTLSVMRGLGGLIIGSGAINFFLRHQTNAAVLRSLLAANIITHVLGLLADVWGVADGALSLTKFAPVELTHLFVGIGSLIYLLRLNTNVNHSG